MIARSHQTQFEIVPFENSGLPTNSTCWKLRGNIGFTLINAKAGTVYHNLSLEIRAISELRRHGTAPYYLFDVVKNGRESVRSS
mmetsp:Transcript_18039/g.32708  ORF Transcript_18039/g.32708 Transcript_18039/m.32708 type:complete len:84 (+) Transcript_18039:116-367(+)